MSDHDYYKKYLKYKQKYINLKISQSGGFISPTIRVIGRMTFINGPGIITTDAFNVPVNISTNALKKLFITEHKELEIPEGSDIILYVRGNQLAIHLDAITLSDAKERLNIPDDGIITVDIEYHQIGGVGPLTAKAIPSLTATKKKPRSMETRTYEPSSVPVPSSVARFRGRIPRRSTRPIPIPSSTPTPAFKNRQSGGIRDMLVVAKMIVDGREIETVPPFNVPSNYSVEALKKLIITEHKELPITEGRDIILYVEGNELTDEYTLANVVEKLGLPDDSIIFVHVGYAQLGGVRDLRVVANMLSGLGSVSTEPFNVPSNYSVKALKNLIIKEHKELPITEGRRIRLNVEDMLSDDNSLANVMEKLGLSDDIIYVEVYYVDV